MSGSPTVSLIGADGTIIDCSGAPFELATNPGIFGLAPTTLTSFQAGGILAGSLPRGARHQEQPIRVGLRVTGATSDEFQDNAALLARTVNPVDGRSGRPTRIIVVKSDRSRYLEGQYASGLEDFDVADYLSRRGRVDLIFRCSNPYWRDLDDVETALDFPITGSGLTPTNYDDPIPYDLVGQTYDGFSGTDADGFATLEIVNDGDVPTYPKWTIEGPLTTLQVSNLEIPASWTFDNALIAGEVLTIDTDPRNQIPVRVDGVNAYSGFVPGSTMFPLQSGSNRIAVQVAGNGTDTVMTCEYRSQWLMC